MVVMQQAKDQRSCALFLSGESLTFGPPLFSSIWLFFCRVRGRENTCLQFFILFGRAFCFPLQLIESLSLSFDGLTFFLCCTLLLHSRLECPLTCVVPNRTRALTVELWPHLVPQSPPVSTVKKKLPANQSLAAPVYKPFYLIV